MNLNTTPKALTLMNLAPRIYRDATQATVDGAERRLQRESIETERLHRNAASRDLDALHDTEDEVVRLQRENRALKQRLAEQGASAVNALRALLDRSEAFSRTMAHLRQAWAPHLPDNEPFKTGLLPLVDEQKAAVAIDTDWLRERDAYVDTVLNPKAASKP